MKLPYLTSALFHGSFNCYSSREKTQNKLSSTSSVYSQNQLLIIMYGIMGVIPL